MGEHEGIRLLYVALTRARDHLVLSLHHKPSNTVRSHAHRIAAALDDEAMIDPATVERAPGTCSHRAEHPTSEARPPETVVPVGGRVTAALEQEWERCRGGMERRPPPAPGPFLRRGCGLGHRGPTPAHPRRRTQPHVRGRPRIPRAVVRAMAARSRRHGDRQRRARRPAARRPDRSGWDRHRGAGDVAGSGRRRPRGGRRDRGQGPGGGGQPPRAAGGVLRTLVARGARGCPARRPRRRRGPGRDRRVRGLRRPVVRGRRRPRGGRLQDRRCRRPGRRRRGPRRGTPRRERHTRWRSRPRRGDPWPRCTSCSCGAPMWWSAPSPTWQHGSPRSERRSAGSEPEVRPTPPRRHPEPVPGRPETISAVTLGVTDMASSVDFYDALGFEIAYGGRRRRLHELPAGRHVPEPAGGRCRDQRMGSLHRLRGRRRRHVPTRRGRRPHPGDAACRCTVG